MSVQYYPGYSQVKVHQNLLVRTILSVTNSYPCVVTTTEDHGYVAGMKISFLVPAQFGMIELNNIIAQVISITDDTLTINLDSSSFTPFLYPSPLPTAYSPPKVIPYSSGPYLPPKPLPYGNQDSFDGVIFNAGVS